MSTPASPTLDGATTSGAHQALLAPADRAALVRSSRRRWAAAAAGSVLLLPLLALSLTVGIDTVGLGTAWDVLTGARSGTEGGEAFVVEAYRIPRTAVAVLAGTCFALGGCLMQGLTRNPLADPGILGTNAGAALAVVLGVAVLGLSGPGEYLWLAFAGAALASVLVYLVGAAGPGGATPLKLTLAGAAVAIVLTTLVEVVLRLDQRRASGEFRLWSSGSLVSTELDVAARVLPFALAGIAAALWCAPRLNGLALGDDVAVTLGQRVGRTRALTALAVVLLCGAGTAAAGPIAFVGLLVPHVVRSLCGPDYRWIVGLSLVYGPALLLACDVVGRLVGGTREVPAGVVVSVVGGPLFVAIARRRRQVAL